MELIREHFRAIIFHNLDVDPCGSSKKSQIQRKLFVEEALWSRWSSVSSARLIMWRLFHLSIVGRSILSSTTICLPKVFGEIRNTNKRRRIFVHHGNASSHTSVQTSDFLTVQNELMGSDLALNYFILFPHNKKKMRGPRFSSPADTVGVFKNHVLDMCQSEWKKCFDKCLNHAGA